MGASKTLVIIIFIEPKAIAVVTPALFTKKEWTTSTIQVEATPIAAAPAERPFNPIAKPIATVEIGATIIIENAIQIRILITYGWSCVKYIIPWPIKSEIILTYGNINKPSVANSVPTTGIRTKLKESNLPSSQSKTRADIEQINMTLIISPVPLV